MSIRVNHSFRRNAYYTLRYEHTERFLSHLPLIRIRMSDGSKAEDVRGENGSKLLIQNYVFSLAYHVGLRYTVQIDEYVTTCRDGILYLAIK